MNQIQKRLFIWIVLFSIVLGNEAFSITACANTANTKSDIVMSVNDSQDEVKIEKIFSVHDITYYAIAKSKKFKTNQVIAMGYTGNKKKISIPESVTYDNTKYTVTKVGNNEMNTVRGYWMDHASQWGTTVNTIVLPNTINELCEYAFVNVKTLKNINIPKSMKYIKGYAFSNTKIEKLTIPKNVEIFEISVFCSNLREIIVDKNNKNYMSSGGALYTKDGKTLLSAPAVSQYTAPKGVSKISFYAFHGNKNLKSVVIPKNVKVVECNAFQECSNLSDVKIEKGINSIGEGAFSCCNSLKKINLPESITELGDCAFEDCTSLESLKIPNKVTTINNLVVGCTNLKTLEIPDSVIEINELFPGCSSLEKIIANRVDNRVLCDQTALFVAAAKKDIQGLDVLLTEDDREGIKILRDFYKTVNDSDSDVIKVKKAHDWLVRFIEYDYDLYYNGREPSTEFNNASFFINRKRVCTGYAVFMSALCDLVDVESMLCFGTAYGAKYAAGIVKTPEGHAWNLIKIDGEWYHLDATWDDLKGDRVGYNYFLISDKQMSKDHQWEASEYPICSNTITNY